MVSDNVVRLGDLFVEPILMGDFTGHASAGAGPDHHARQPLPALADPRLLPRLGAEDRYQRVLVGRVSHRIEPAAVTAQVEDALRT